MNMDPLDKVLVTDDRLVPSSGFHSRVMDDVFAEEARRPPPAFPWGRFAAGVVTCLSWAIAAASFANQMDWSNLAPVLSIVESSHGRDAVLIAAGSLLIVAIPRLRSIE